MVDENPMHNAHVAHLLAMLEDYTENAEQRKMVQKWAATEERENPDRFLLALVGAIYDGLAYGNWMWRKRP